MISENCILWTNLYVGGNDNERRKCSLSREKMGTGNKTTLDLDDLNAGADYTDLKTSYIIFICISDIFEKGLGKYKFENSCIDENNQVAKLNDRAYKLFFIAKNYDKILNEKQRAFLELVINNTSLNSFTNRIKELVEKAKQNTQWRKQFMDFEHYLSLSFKQGKEEGAQEKAIENAINCLNDGDSPEKVSRCIGLPLEKVLELQKENMQKK